jgi:sulfur-carrier protein
MARVTFTDNLKRHVSCPSLEVGGATVREILEEAFAIEPRLRSYVLNDQGGLRRHVVVFVDGAQIEDRRMLSDPVSAAADVYVMQALSGGLTSLRSIL